MRRLSLLLPVSLLLGACVYSSPVPLADPATAPFDEALLGAWLPDSVEQDEAMDPRTFTAADSFAAAIRVFPFNEREYVVYVGDECHDCRQLKTMPMVFRGFLTDVDGVRLLNLRQLGVEDTSYSFLRIVRRGDELRVSFIADGGEKSERGLHGEFTTVSQLRAAVRPRVHDPMLYEEDETVLRRVRPVGNAQF